MKQSLCQHAQVMYKLEKINYRNFKYNMEYSLNIIHHFRIENKSCKSTRSGWTIDNISIILPVSPKSDNKNQMFQVELVVIKSKVQFIADARNPFGISGIIIKIVISEDQKLTVIHSIFLRKAKIICLKNRLRKQVQTIKRTS